MLEARGTLKFYAKTDFYGVSAMIFKNTILKGDFFAKNGVQKSANLKSAVRSAFSAKPKKILRENRDR